MNNLDDVFIHFQFVRGTLKKKVELKTERAVSKVIELISQALNFKNKSGFDFQIQNNWEFLSFRTDYYYIDNVILWRISKATGMVLIEIEFSNCLTEICFGTPSETINLVKYWVFLIL